MKALTKFGLDFIVPVKLTHACGCLLSGVVSRARGLQTLQGAGAFMVDELGVVTGSLEDLALQVKAAEPIVENRLIKHVTAEFMEAERVVGGASGFSIQNYSHFLNKYPSNKNSLHHLFRKKAGHVSGTVENKKIILEMVQQAKNCLGEVRGVIWYAQTNAKGEQWWACVWAESHEIRNCGINLEPRSWDKNRGLNILRYIKKVDND